MIDDDSDDSCFGPCQVCGLNEDTSYYFRPLNVHTCHECRKANRHLMTIGDTWVELVLKWDQIQPYWLWRAQFFLYQLFKLGPIGMYRHRKAMGKIYFDAHQRVASEERQ